MSLRIKNDENLFYLKTQRNIGLNKNNRIKILLPSKPYFLNGSNISKMLHTISFNKTCKNNDNSFLFKEKNEINKKKVKYLNFNNNNSKEMK